MPRADRWGRPDQVLNRVGVVALLGTFFMTGYFGLALGTDPQQARELSTTWDRAIPFVADTVWIYLAILPLALCPVFFVRCASLTRRGAMAYAFVMSVSFICYLLFPVTSARLRRTADALDASQFSQWAVSVLYRVDPPFNLFPSLHLSIAAVAAFVVWKASRFMGTLLFVAVALVAMSVCTTKQHFLFDVLGGLALAGTAALLFLRSYDPRRHAPRVLSWRGPLALVVLLAAMYGGFVVAFRLTHAQETGLWRTGSRPASTCTPRPSALASRES